MPGTHDAALCLATLRKLRQLRMQPNSQFSNFFTIPVYDKSLNQGKGNRLPATSWRVLTSPPEVFIFEGWMLGFTHLTNSASDYFFNHTSPSCLAGNSACAISRAEKINKTKVCSPSEKTSAEQHPSPPSYFSYFDNASQISLDHLAHLQDVDSYLAFYKEIWAELDYFLMIKPILPESTIVPIWREQQEQELRLRTGASCLSPVQILKFVQRCLPLYFYHGARLHAFLLAHTTIGGVMQNGITFPDLCSHSTALLLSKDSENIKHSSLASFPNSSACSQACVHPVFSPSPANLNVNPLAPTCHFCSSPVSLSICLSEFQNEPIGDMARDGRFKIVYIDSQRRPVSWRAPGVSPAMVPPRKVFSSTVSAVALLPSNLKDEPNEVKNSCGSNLSDAQIPFVTNVAAPPVQIEAFNLNSLSIPLILSKISLFSVTQNHVEPNEIDNSNPENPILKDNNNSTINKEDEDASGFNEGSSMLLFRPMASRDNVIPATLEEWSSTNINKPQEANFNNNNNIPTDDILLPNDGWKNYQEMQKNARQQDVPPPPADNRSDVASEVQFSSIPLLNSEMNNVSQDKKNICVGDGAGPLKLIEENGQQQEQQQITHNEIFISKLMKMREMIEMEEDDVSLT